MSSDMSRTCSRKQEVAFRRKSYILKAVIVMCKEKSSSYYRIRKLAQAVEASMHDKEGWGFDPNKSSHQMLSTVLQRAGWQRGSQTTTEVLADNFARAVRTVTKSSSDEKFL